MRLAHSAEAYRRLMQMSTARLFVFIDGRTEMSFYDQLCESVCRPSGVPFEVRTADDVAGGSGGKENPFAPLLSSRALGTPPKVCPRKKTRVSLCHCTDSRNLTGSFAA